MLTFFKASYLRTTHAAMPTSRLTSGCAQWRSQPKNLGGGEYFDFKRETVFGSVHGLSRHLATRYG